MEMDPKRCFWMQFLGKLAWKKKKRKEVPDRRSSQQVSNPAVELIKKKFLIKRKKILIM